MNSLKNVIIGLFFCMNTITLTMEQKKKTPDEMLKIFQHFNSSVGTPDDYSSAEQFFNMGKEAYNLAKMRGNDDPVKEEALKAVEQFKAAAKEGNLSKVKKIVKENDGNPFFKMTYGSIIGRFAKSSDSYEIMTFTDSWQKGEIKRKDINIDEKN